MTSSFANNSLFLLVTCTLEESRKNILFQVVNNLKEQNKKFNFFDDLIVFDNNSSFPEAVELLKETFPHVYQSKKNVGFWSAINWTLQNYQSILKKDYKYIYIIESDCIHYDMWKLRPAEITLEANPNIGCIRTEEFFVALAHLYDKDNQSKDSKNYAWCRQFNSHLNKKVTFDLLCESWKDYINNKEDKKLLYLGPAYFYKTLFVAKVCGLTKIDVMKYIFKKLSELKEFSEMHFQKFYHDLYQFTGLLDGGIFHCKLGNQKEGVLTGSNTDIEKQLQIGYIPTRTGKIHKLEEMEVVDLISPVTDKK